MQKEEIKLYLITNRIKIKELILDAEIYDDGYIPDGYLKPKEL